MPTPELREAKDHISDMVKEQDPNFSELRGVGVGLNDTIVVLVKDAETTKLVVPETYNGFEVKFITVGDPRAL